MSQCFILYEAYKRREQEKQRNTNIDITGRAMACNMEDIIFPTTFEEYKNSIQMKKKGNVLQYKKNQTPLSQTQIYSKKVKNLWTNRKKSWASQSDQYTFPNTSSLLRVGTTLVHSSSSCAIVSNSTSPILEIPSYAYTTPPVDSENIPDTIGPITNENQEPVTQPINPPPSCTYVDNGVLICTKVVDPLTGEVILNTYTQKCYPTSDSDVPGIGVLCWTEGEQTSFN
jgi:hypothetical protein